MDFMPINLDIWIKTALTIVRLHYFCELPFNQINDDVAGVIRYAVPASDAAIGRTFATAAQTQTRIRTCYNLDWMFSQLRQAAVNAGVSMSVDVSADRYGSDEEDDNTDEEMPPLVDLSDWETDSGYGTDDSDW
ncbi:hypothetical protein C8J56DRAFT_890493 [Mycena floridula]|nr:hypothetical protein C8J56DRAFT_890493 [Mycena floridula]